MNRIVALVALAAMALVGFDLLRRPARHVANSAERVRRGRGVPLEALSHRLLPQLESAAAYRAFGLLIVAAAVLVAILVVPR